jgi:hypothetical protein
MALALAVVAPWMPLRASLESYSGFKGEIYSQNRVAAPGSQDLDQHGILLFAVPSDSFFPFLILATPEGASALPLALMNVEISGDWYGEAQFDTTTDRDQFFPDGPYNLQALGFDGIVEASFNLVPSSLPPIPAVVNYSELQSLDPAQAFTLRWNSFTGATDNDRIRVQIEGDNEIVFATPAPGASGALPGTATEVVIPAGTLQGIDFISVTVSFFKVGSQQAGSQANSTTLTGSYRSTLVEVDFEGPCCEEPGDGPVIAFVSPSFGTMNVAPDTIVRFTFSKPMAPIVDIVWAQNGVVLDDSLFDYSWSQDGRVLNATYTPGFLGGQLVTWSIQEGMEDTEGFAVEGDFIAGFFTTGSGSTGPDDCDDDIFEMDGHFSVNRMKSFFQIDADSLVTDGDFGSSFSTQFRPPDGFETTSAVVTAPDGTALTLQSLFGSVYFHYESFNTSEEVEEVYPAGTYSARIEHTAGSAIQLSAALSANFPPAPRLVNYAEAQSIQADADFTLRWNSFTGANASSYLTLEIFDSEGEPYFSAPDFCEEIELDPTATSIVIPAGTLPDNANLQLVLIFTSIEVTQNHAGSDINLLLANSTFTETTIRTGSGQPSSDLKFTEFRIGANGRFQATITGAPGINVVFEASTDLTTWAPLITVPVPGTGSLNVEDPRQPEPNTHQIYRVRRL